MDNFILQKNVNWSLLNYGISIPVAAHSLFSIWDSAILTHGESRKIKILIDDVLYDALLVNQNFNKGKFIKHKDIIQIRYSEKSPIAQKIKKIFHRSYSYFLNQREQKSNERQLVSPPPNIHESIKLYFTSSPNVLSLECIADSDYHNMSLALNNIPEELYESNDDIFFMSDRIASIVEKEKIVKFRKIDRNVIKLLKEYYDYRDQISGEKIGTEYGDSVVEAHHIDYFTTSQNNDSTNIVIISPNFHRIIHVNNPFFNRKKFQFEFSNGEILKLKLYNHLL